MQPSTFLAPELVTVMTRKRGAEGFTLIELIVVTAILAVLAAYFVVRLQAPASLTLPQQADVLVRDIRHLQTLSVTWSQPLQLNITTTGYSVRCVNSSGVAPCVAAGDVVQDPATRSPFEVILQEGVLISGGHVEFDNLGRPSNGGSLLTANQTLTLSAAGTSVEVAISPLTGFVAAN